MVNIRNNGTSLDVDFNFNTYHLPKGKNRRVPEELVTHLKENYPPVFDFNVYIKKSEKTPPVVKSTKTRSFLDRQKAPASDMRATVAGSQTPTFNAEVDTDGFVGPGLEVDNLI